MNIISLEKKAEILNLRIFNRLFAGKSRDELRELLTKNTLTPAAREMAEYFYEFYYQIKDEQTWEREQVLSKQVEINLNYFKEGNRNYSFFYYACKLRDCGYSIQQAEFILFATNQKIKSPLDEKEVLSCINSAYKRVQ